MANIYTTGKLKQSSAYIFLLACFFFLGQAKLGMKECVQHDLLQPYPVLWEKEGDYVAHVKFTVLVMPNGTFFFWFCCALGDLCHLWMSLRGKCLLFNV